MLLEEPSGTVVLFVEPMFQAMFKSVEQLEGVQRTSIPGLQPDIG